MTLGKAQDGDRRQGGTPGLDNAILWDLEARHWTSGADSARTVTATNAVMILPYPPGILQGEQILEHMKKNTGWRTVEMKDRSQIRQGAIAVLAYRVFAEKSGSPIYEALCASTYFLDNGRWLRLSHQQTPTT
ncbi:hypothetical protein [Ruegeria conchae]|uniref:DUF4440 domain-containing protein n=1 Tax=Ruegeria conchae TaxID=981384 RepID=A0A497ZJW8_9RHOB|nr:hypothetical protein [Ruegeria conchae]RLK07283.1 hypothetical protein CLV75_2399 [Ruegeria conchae]